VNGRMVANMKVLGWITKSMVMEFTHGLMVENIKVIIKMIKKTALVFIVGLMVESILVNGKMISDMGEESILLMKITLKKDYGKMTRE